MKSKHLNIVYLIMIILSLIVVYSFYQSWNVPSTKIPSISDTPLHRFSIDSCVFGEKEIYVRGWAFVDGNKNILNRVFAIGKDGKPVEVMNSLEIRNDVSKAFNEKTKYDNSGFVARRRQVDSAKDFTKEIILTSNNPEGDVNATKIKCK